MYLKDKNKWQSRNESETRSDFLDPMIKALGWDSPDEVRRELPVADEDRRKKIDYVFLLNGIEKLVVEAKAIKEDISRIEFAKQTIGYAYNLSCNWGVLTDFEDVKIFHVGEQGEVFRNIDLSDIERFDENFESLWLISRESFLHGTIDKKAEDEGRKPKTVRIDQDLLQSLNDWRERIYKDIKFRYAKKYSDDLIEEMVQKVIDRLIFIRKIEDMQGKRVLQPLIRQDPPNMYKELKRIFEKFNQEYNSKLFGENAKDLHEADVIDLSNSTLSKVIEGMYQPSGRNVEYNFSLIDADVLGNIYEQYLGHILKRKKVVEGKTHRREQGIYYTPTYVVDYIVKNTVGELLKDRRIDRKKIRVLDAACGSGSFLIKAYDHLLGYRKMKEGSDSQAILDLEEGVTFTRKTQIVRENIFGVDLDAKAVEIAQLNLLMKIAETKERLPTLKNNIQIGNSLISDENLTTCAFDWHERFKTIVKDEGGFHAVIGNPPYINAVQLKNTYGDKVKAYWKQKFKSAEGTYDIYILFFEQALSVCREGGYVSFITPNKYLSAPYGAAFRKFILENYTLLKVIDLSRVRVFNDPSVYPVITVFQKKKSTKEYTIETEKVFSEDMIDKKSYTISSKTLKMMPENNWGIILSDNASLIQKIFEKSKQLEQISTVNATATAAEGDEFRDIITEKSGAPFINTGTIDRYGTTYGIVPFKSHGQKILKPKLDLTSKVVSDNRRTLFKSPKIIFAKLALRPEAFLDTEGKYASAATNCVHSPSEEYPLKYLVAILNSKLMAFIYSELFSGLKMGGGYFQFQAPQLRILPIVNCSDSDKAILAALVDKIMFLTSKSLALGDVKSDEKARLQEQIKNVDNEIDELIYKIYGINEDEKKIIEKSLTRV